MTMRRRIAEALICLFLGSLLAVAIGWLGHANPSMAALAPAWSNSWYEHRGHVWLVRARQGMLSSQYSVHHGFDDSDPLWDDRLQSMRDGIRPEVSAWRVPAWVTSRNDQWRSIQAYGWPLRCVMYAWDGPNWQLARPRQQIIIAGQPRVVPVTPPKPVKSAGLYVFPEHIPLLGGTSIVTTPVWFGLAVNSAFYGFMVWLALFGTLALVRRRRRKRGQCDACGYDLAGLTLCPECGTPCTGEEKAA